MATRAVVALLGLGLAPQQPVVQHLPPGIVPPAVQPPPVFVNRSTPFGHAPGHPLLADFDGDGDLDLAALDVEGVEALSILVASGRGDGTFDPPMSYPLQGAARSLFKGDFDGDGVIDLMTGTEVRLVGGRFRDQLEILRGRGDGTFEASRAPTMYSPPGLMEPVLVGDFNGDHLDDVVTLESFALVVRINAAFFTFFPPLTVPTDPPASFSNDEEAGDFNADGILDLALATGNGGVVIDLGLGDGSFARQPAVPVPGGTATNLRVGDFDADGHADVVTSRRQDDPSINHLWLFRGHGDGTLAAPVERSLFGDPMTTFDMDRDGIDDLVGMDGVLFGGIEPFSRQVVYQAGGLAGAGAFGDLDGDGVIDVALVNGQAASLTVMRGNGDMTLGRQRATTLDNGGLGFSRPAAGQFDGDGRLDLVTFSFTGTYPDFQSAYWPFFGKGDGSFDVPGPVPAQQSGAADAADLNHDGKVDLVVAGSGFSESAGPLVLLGRGDGTFEERSTSPTGPSDDLLLADFDGDGLADLVSSQYGAGLISLQRGNGDGSFGPPQRFGVGEGPGALGSGDFDGDGRRDLVVANLGFSGSKTLTVLYGAGDGVFGGRQALPTGGAPNSLVVADFDEDGRPDIAATALFAIAPPIQNSREVLIYMNRGPGNFELLAPISVGSSPTDVIADDFDGDHHLDLVVANWSSDDLSFLHGRGDGSFDPQDRYAAGVAPSWLGAGDFTGDGRPDLAVALAGSNYACCPTDHGIVVLPNILVPDADHDGIPDAEDPCTDTDGDGFGNPGFASNTCAADNCPRVANPGQGDSDHDGVGDACDLCPGVADPGQRDQDRDGMGDACDTCTDSDGDGLGDPGFPANTCPADGCPLYSYPYATGDSDGDGVEDLCDNCPTTPNPDQADADRDHLGDACDSCIDSDGDGLGDPGLAGNTCRVDNCPSVPNSNQRDADHDGLGDACDPCTDADGDGYGENPLNNRGADLCPADNCQYYNPGQENSDGDQYADACDFCPFDPFNDQDVDGKCGDVDNCPVVSNPGQADGDSDAVGDVCDNCPTVANPDQADSNHDGDGDACQPSVSIDGITEDGGLNLEVQARAGDPQGQPIHGTMTVRTLGAVVQQHLLDQGFDHACENGFWPAGVPGAGVGYLGASVGNRVLFDMDSNFGCQDGIPDFRIAVGSCQSPGYFDYYLDLTSRPLPLQVCLQAATAAATRYQITVLAATDTDLTIAVVLPDTEHLSVPIDGALPPSTPLPALEEGPEYVLKIEVTDGETKPISAERPFHFHNESFLVIRAPNSPPHALVSAASTAECDRPGGGAATLDGSGSFDPDAASGNGIATYEWFEAPVVGGQPGSIGTGSTLTTVLSMGTHHLSLRVTDAGGVSDTAPFDITVRDTVAPTLEIATDPQTLWPPNHELRRIAIAATARDLCDAHPAIALVSVTSSEPDDAGGNLDGGTLGDVSGADLGTNDADVALRAERSGGGAGRVYTLTYAATDASGNRTPAIAVVTVPHDQGGGPEPLLVRVESPDAVGRLRLYWPAFTGAVGYDVLQGDLGQYRIEGRTIALGNVRVLARSLAATWIYDAANVPAVGRGFFYLVEPRDPRGGLGFGTESVPYPRVPSACDGACP